MMRKHLVRFASVLTLGGVLGCASDGGNGEVVAETNEAITVTWSGLLDQFGLSPATGDVAAVHRGNGVVNLVTNDSSGNVVVWRNDGGWQAQVLPHPSGVTFFGVGAANNNGKLEIVATTGNVHRLYYAHSTDTGSGVLNFTAWTQISGAAPFGGPGRVTLDSWGQGRLDAFWTTTSGKIGHAWGTNALSSVESGDTAGVTYLQPLHPSTALNLDVVSWGVGRLDLLLGNGPQSTPLQHHWFDANAGGWGSGASLHREALGIAKTDVNSGFDNVVQEFAALSASSGNFDIYGVNEDVGGVKKIYHAKFSNSFGWSTTVLNGSTLVGFDPLNNVQVQPPAWPISGLFWNGTHGVFGNTSGTVSQLVY